MMMRSLTLNEIETLKTQGCTSSNWAFVTVCDNFDIDRIRNVRFNGPVTIHDNVTLLNIPGGISGCSILSGAIIDNVASIEFDTDSNFGVGTLVAVLDETGSRSIPIYPGISSQMATLFARDPRWIQKKEQPEIKEFLDSKVPPAQIGEGAIIKNCGIIKNVSIGREVKIIGASYLNNGTIINNAAPGRGFTFIGSGVEAENFILEDGKLESKASLLNSYVGQGSVISLGFSARDSIFFSNCSMENGEAHALLAGPYTVSMHKGTLLISCQTSFMNAGSLTNQSNHMYKLGPVHWGLLERGVKTSSSSYLMLGAKIGAFSLVMGSHKTHPDSSEFPFSYLFGEERGATVVVPAVMLRSCGLLRDESKWPARDRRLNRDLPFFDHITFNVLNPFTVDTMLEAIHTIENLLSKPTDDDLFMRYKGMKFTRAALERAKSLYTLAIFKYLSITLKDNKFPENDGLQPELWVDLGGQVLTRDTLNKAIESDSVLEAENIFSEAYHKYHETELKWIGRRFGSWWRERQEHIKFYTMRFDDMIEEDRQQYLQMLARETEMLAL